MCAEDPSQQARFELSANLAVHSRVIDWEDLPALFAEMASTTRCFYYRSVRGEELLGLGVAAGFAPCEEAKLSAQFERVRRTLGLAQKSLDTLPGALEQIRLVGWSSFSPQPPTPTDITWQGYPRVELYIPQILLRRVNQQTRAVLTCAPLQAALIWQRFMKQIEQLRRNAPRLIAARSEVDSRWLDRVSFCAGVDYMRSQREVERVVLARRASLILSEANDLYTSLVSLFEAHPKCAAFALSSPQNSDYPVFFGATPHRLTRVDEQQLSALALATSAACLDAARLSEDPRAAGEHRQMVELMREALTPLSAEIDYEPTPRVQRLSNVSHLSTEIKAKLKPGKHLAHAIDALHPLPTVFGAPPRAARDIIRRFEGFDRGLYTGALGWMNLRGEGEFDVALRCALLGEYKALLFAGAGTTQQSDIELEWTETLQKFEPLLRALGARSPG